MGCVGLTMVNVEVPAIRQDSYFPASLCTHTHSLYSTHTSINVYCMYCTCVHRECQECVLYTKCLKTCNNGTIGNTDYSLALVPGQQGSLVEAHCW